MIDVGSWSQIWSQMVIYDLFITIVDSTAVVDPLTRIYFNQTIL